MSDNQKRLEAMIDYAMRVVEGVMAEERELNPLATEAQMFSLRDAAMRGAMAVLFELEKRESAKID
jgi:hypothetical protein